MKKITYISSLFILLVFIALMAIFLVRRASYTIQTSGKLYIVNKKSRDVNVFNLFTGKEIAKIPVNMESHEAIATADENKIVLTNYGAIGTDGNLIKVLNTKTNAIEKTINFDTPIRANGIVATPIANEVGVIDYVKDEFLIINIVNDSIVRNISTEQKNSHLAVLHPNKPLAYVTNINSGSISVIDLNLNKVVKIIPCGLGRKGVDITPDGSELWVSNNKDRTIAVINTSTYGISKTLKSGKDPIKLKFSVDGKYCLVANANDGNISVFNRKTKKKIKTIIFHGKTTILEKILYHTPYPVNILMHPNGKYVFVSNSNANEIEVIDMKTFQVVSTIGTGKIPDALVFIE